MMAHTLLWLQRDLRINDNDSLNWALSRGNPILAVYIHSPEEDAPWAAGSASRWWLHHSLKKLSAALAEIGVKLQFFKANSLDIIPQLINAYEVDAISWTNRHEPQRSKTETLLSEAINTLAKGKQKSIMIKRFNDALLAHPEQFLTKTHATPYKVFTPFYKRFRQNLNTLSFVTWSTKPVLKYYQPKFLHDQALRLQDLDLLDNNPWHNSWHNKLHQHWSPGENDARKRLDHFIVNIMNGYTEHRNIPSIDGTSALSPYLHFGEISPRKIIDSLLPRLEFNQSQNINAAEGFIRQLIWREFARYILWHFPYTANEPMNPKFDSSFWRTNNAYLKHWQQGNTGIAIVDAGMLQLWETGWMHNRVRLLAASLLCKNMGIFWQEGARWFWETLVDADLANNSMGWQWVAGCGVDAAPYYRIFNPNTQAQRFDPKQIYINRWLEQKPADKQTKAIIDLKTSRSNALATYKRLIRDPRKSQ